MKDNIKIEMRGEINPYNSGKYYIQWRICPSELGWFRKLFNGWKYLFACSYDEFGISALQVNKDLFSTYKETYKTLADIRRYERQQKDELARYREKQKSDRYIYWHIAINE